jgi:hypothetical protein
MDPQVHGAIVGGLIGGPIVGLSLAGEHWLSRLGTHRADVEATVTELDQLVRRVAERVLTKRVDREDIALTAAHNADIDRFSRAGGDDHPPSSLADAPRRRDSGRGPSGQQGGR